MALTAKPLKKIGTKDNDTLTGGAGDDTLIGLGGNDLLDGGIGNDVLKGGSGHDRLFGRAGDDVLDGDSGNDRLDGGVGNDQLFGGTGIDLLFGGEGNDRIDGGKGNDRLAGGIGDDLLIGTSGADTFEGGIGNDTMILGSTLPTKVDGGTGIDRASISALGPSIDLSGALAARFGELEILDLGGGKANTLTLNAASVIAMAGGGGAFPDGALLVKGDAGDTVDLDGAWTKGATVSNPFGEAGTYVRYTNGTAQVLAESELAVVTGATPPPGTVDLGTLDGMNGFTILGVDGSDSSGFSVSSAGDVNGDGFDDVIVGAPFATTPGGVDREGESYVVFGKASWDGTPALDLATLDGANGFRLTGIDERNFSGFSVSSAGDVNGDGFADVIVGAPRVSAVGKGYDYEGESYVVFGKASWAGTPSLDLADLDGTNGFSLRGIDRVDQAGYSVSSAGDVNGDGFTDLIVGAINADYTGESYVVFGKASWAGTPSLDLADLDGANGFRLSGTEGEGLSGYSVSSAGDVNGDGFADLIVGAPQAGADIEGESYVVFGKASWAGTPSLDLATLDGSNGFRLTGIEAIDRSGRSVSSAGDVNGDGFADLIVGAPFAESADEAELEGESYVVFGKASWAGTPSLDLAVLDGSNGFRLTGIDAGDVSGFSVSAAGDVNGDGMADLIVGAFQAESGSSYEGESYVVYGKASWAGTPSLDLAALDGTNGFRLIGADAGDNSGRSVASAGDVNGDGFADLIVGAPRASAVGGETYEGESYVIFGGNFNGAVTHLGGIGDETLTGTAAAETFVGGTGNDTMLGNGGADSFQGGAGNDTMVVGSGLPLYLSGGTGIDTVNLDARGATIDLAGLDGSRFVEIEKIDLGGTGANTLRLDAQSVTNMAGTNGDEFDDNTLLVKGDVGDAVNLDGTWTKGATLSDPLGQTGSYTEFTDGQARVLVESDLAVLSSAPAAIDLAALDGNNGFRLSGIDEFDFAGRSVSSAGDINGDGFDDVIIGAESAESAGGDLEGESYVVFGKANWAATPAVDLATLDGTNGFRLIGVEDGGRSGFAVSSAGDVNDDGFEDLIVGAPGGKTAVVFGKASWEEAATLDLATLDGTNGFLLKGGDGTGASVSAGDVNGDGFSDLVLGAPGAETAYELESEGASYVVFGKASWAGTPFLDLATLDGNNGFGLIGVDAYDDSGTSVSAAGDVNGDGFADLIIGAPSAEEGIVTKYEGSSGESYLVFGKSSWTGTPSLDLATLDGTNGVRLTGIDEDDHSGRSVAIAGDVNGDGFADLIIGAYAAESDASTSAEGASYVVFGKADWAGTPSLDLAALDGTNGFTLTGADSGDASGVSVSTAGDVNGDGFDDLIIGAVAAGAASEGESYVVYGKSSWGDTPSIDLASLDGTNGFRLVGVDEADASGASVSSAGDVNGDGFDDLIVGAVQADITEDVGTNEGEGYVVFGGNFTGAVTHLGDSGDNSLIGTAAAESFVGGTGNDTLEGKGGVDAFQGGAGNDVMSVASLDFLAVDGGSGFDTLALDGSSLLFDLTASADSRTRGIEHIDIAGTGDNTLTLSIADVLSLSDESNEVRVSGDSGDTVDIGAGWSAAASGGTNGNGTSTIGGETYQIYTGGQATLLVDADVTATV